MKKRIVSFLLAAAMSMTTITGCGVSETGSDVEQETRQESEAEETDEDAEEEAEEEAEEAKEEDNEASEEATEEDNEASEEATEEATEATTESTEDAAEAEEEATVETTEEPTAEPVEESTQEPAEETTEQTVEVADGDVDWSTAYEGYFDNNDVLSDNVMISTSVSQDGVTYALKIGMAGEEVYMNYDFGVVALDLYADAENIYTCSFMEGQEAWTYAPITSEDDADSVMGMQDVGMVNTNTFTEYAYYETVTEDGIVYDVLSFEANDAGEISTGYCYINRETQKLSKMVTDTATGPVTVEIEEIDDIEIPAEALNGTEVTMEDISTTILGVIFYGAFYAMDQQQ